MRRGDLTARRRRPDAALVAHGDATADRPEAPSDRDYAVPIAVAAAVVGVIALIAATWYAWRRSLRQRAA